MHLAVTSPPYWHIKDYGLVNQIGYGQTLHEYLKDLYRVWNEVYRVLKPGRRLVINIGDQFARSIIYGRYKIIPLHSELIGQCEQIGFDYLGSIIWQKKTTMNTTGGANVMGSYPYPPNGMIEIDYEFVLIFKKPGQPEIISRNVKDMSKLTKEEWKEYFLGHWCFGGAGQIEHEAMFPEELPKRIIKMFSFVGETVLDPFVGSGTTVKVAMNNNRNAIGYEINADFEKIIRDKLNFTEPLLLSDFKVNFVSRGQSLHNLPEISYEPSIQDANQKIDPKLFNFRDKQTYKVLEITESNFLVLSTGLKVRLLGLKIPKENEIEVFKYLRNFVLGKEVHLKFDIDPVKDKDTVDAYVYLKNKIFINKYLIQSRIATVDNTADFKLKTKFLKLAG
ncbi:MAG: site-specific DNA-methyltransferase [Candidatus Glassbacteria bacterium]